MEVFEKVASKLNLTEEASNMISNLLKKYKTLDEVGKLEFITKAKDSLKEQLNKIMMDKQNVGWFTLLLYSDYMPLLIAVILLVILFVFFGYKLYKSLSERERKREEKKKNKQMKKKK